MKRIKIGLLPKIAIAIVLGVVCGLFFNDAITRIFVTFNSIFGNFLSFLIPLIIVGLVTPAITDIGKGAGRLLLLTTALAYLFTIFSGFFTLGVGTLSFPSLISANALSSEAMAETGLAPYFTIDIPPLMSVMTALIMAFVLGLGIAALDSRTLKSAMEELRDVVMMIISKAIIPLLPLYIFGIFLNITISGQVFYILGVFLKLIGVIFGITIVILLLQFTIAGIVARKNPFKMLGHMMTAYMTALGTQSSAATIPVTLEQAIKCGVRPEIAGFTVPLCATIHLSGSTIKITACAMAIMMINGTAIDPQQFAGFIMMLGITMIAAPGIPGGAIMASLGLLQSMLGFSEIDNGLMIALYITMDSFGTATNVTGDGAIALIINKIAK
ncbi:MAG: dicarboxylate/amino acid:cation symporter [Rikenellaceae bacterium]|nr:dicarboxylate/amino acid:cation symporter [Rikenellaceae bacterium]